MELKPCPFCGVAPLTKIKDAQLIENRKDIIPNATVQILYKVVLYCPNCLTSSPKRNVMAIGTSIYEIDDITCVPFKAKDGLVEAADTWNRRYDDAAEG